MRRRLDPKLALALLALVLSLAAGAHAANGIIESSDEVASNTVDSRVVTDGTLSQSDVTLEVRDRLPERAYRFARVAPGGAVSNVEGFVATSIVRITDSGGNPTYCIRGLDPAPTFILATPVFGSPLPAAANAAIGTRAGCPQGTQAVVQISDHRHRLFDTDLEAEDPEARGFFVLVI